MNPVDLGEMIKCIRENPSHADLLVGFHTGDDAAVYRLQEDLAVIVTMDFFTPIVDDPYSFGQIAAANALSDVYAMGGEPRTALNMVCFPSQTLPLSILTAILKGGQDTVEKAGALIVGGHTIEDQEPKYGLSVLGTIHPKDLITNAGAQEGDMLVLTKPIGGGIVATGLKKGRGGPEILQEMIRVMGTLNQQAAQIMQKVGVHACTDITGFGLLGHAHELAQASGVALEIYSSQVPVLPGCRSLLNEGILPGGSRANRSFLEGKVDFSPSLTQEDAFLLCDAMTSGGLLMAVSPKRLPTLLSALQDLPFPPAVVGQVVPGETGFLSVQ